MNHYEQATIGTIQLEIAAKQLISYEGFVFNGRNGVPNVTPTDIDGLVQLDKENCFIFIELKHHGDMPSGQADALAALCDGLTKGEVNCIAIQAEHNIPAEKVIVAKDTMVKKVYWNGKWRKPTKPRTLKQLADGYVEYLKKEEAAK